MSDGRQPLAVDGKVEKIWQCIEAIAAKKRVKVGFRLHKKYCGDAEFQWRNLNLLSGRQLDSFRPRINGHRPSLEIIHFPPIFNAVENGLNSGEICVR